MNKFTEIDEVGIINFCSYSIDSAYKIYRYEQ